MGLGVVGSGLIRALSEMGESSSPGWGGLPLHVSAVLVRDLKKQRDVAVDPGVLTTNANEILGNADVDIVVEVLGGEEPARQHILTALGAGKHVVTANKEVIAKHGPELVAQAQTHGVNLRYEASVGAGIPVISALGGSLASNHVSGIWAIINGTTNYILTRMAAEGIDFQDVLADAQRLGYAEPDPTNDVEGIDAGYKLSILATLAFGSYVGPESIFREGISNLHVRDFRYARELGYAIKLLAIAKEENGAIQTRVHPVFLPENLLLAKVDGVFNAVQLQGDLAGRLLLYGRGAGPEPTASGLLGDVIEIAKGIHDGNGSQNFAVGSVEKPLIKIADLETRYYLRLRVADHAGVLAEISRVFAKWEISIASVIQKENDEVTQLAELVVLTHVSREAALQGAAEELRTLPDVEEIGSLIRVEQ